MDVASGNHSNPLARALLAAALQALFARAAGVERLLAGGDEPAGVRPGRVGGRVQLRERRHCHARGDGRTQALRSVISLGSTDSYE